MINRLRGSNIANPGASAAVTVYDETTVNSDSMTKAGVLVAALISQNYTLRTWWAPDLTSPLRLRKSTAITADATHATRTLTCVAKSAIAAGGGTNDYFTCQGTLFEFKKDGAFVATTGRTTVDVTSATTATDVAVIVAAALRTAFPAASALTTSLSIAVPSTAVITLVQASSGSVATITLTENVADAGFTVGALTAGTDGTLVIYPMRLLPGRNAIDILMGSTAAIEFAVAVETVDDVASGGL